MNVPIRCHASAFSHDCKAWSTLLMPCTPRTALNLYKCLQVHSCGQLTTSFLLRLQVLAENCCLDRTESRPKVAFVSSHRHSSWHTQDTYCSKSKCLTCGGWDECHSWQVGLKWFSWRNQATLTLPCSAMWHLPSWDCACITKLSVQVQSNTVISHAPCAEALSWATWTFNSFIQSQVLSPNLFSTDLWEVISPIHLLNHCVLPQTSRHRLKPVGHSICKASLLASIPDTQKAEQIGTIHTRLIWGFRTIWKPPRCGQSPSQAAVEESFHGSWQAQNQNNIVSVAINSTQGRPKFYYATYEAQLSHSL